MRLGQLARKHDLPVQDVIDFLEERTGEKFQPNAKLYDTVVTLVYDHFQVMPPSEEVEEVQEPVDLPAPVKDDLEETTKEEPPTPAAVEDPKWKVELSPEEEIALLGGDLEKPASEPEEQVLISTKEPEPEEEEPTEDEIIQTDKLLEMVEAGEISEEELLRIKQIKAPKRELAGLKVVGKIELPEPKKKEPKEEKKSDAQKVRNRKPELSEEEKEKRRLRAKRKQEQYEARQEKRRKEKEAEELKRKKEAHYRERLKQAEKAKQKGKKPKVQAMESEIEQVPTVTQPKAEPKTMLGKVWKWLNS